MFDSSSRWLRSAQSSISGPIRIPPISSSTTCGMADRKHLDDDRGQSRHEHDDEQGLQLLNHVESSRRSAHAGMILQGGGSWGKSGRCDRVRRCR